MRSWCWLLGHRWEPLGVSSVVEAAVDTVVKPFSWWLPTGLTLAQSNRECARDGCGARRLTADDALLMWANVTRSLRLPGDQHTAWAPAPPQLGISLHLPRQRRSS